MPSCLSKINLRGAKDPLNPASSDPKLTEAEIIEMHRCPVSKKRKPAVQGKPANEKLDTRTIPYSIREPCIDIIETRGFSADPFRRYLTRKPAPPPAPDSKQRVKQPKYMSCKDMDRLKTAAKVESMEDQVARVMEAEDYKIFMTEIGNKTKHHFQQIDDARRRLIAKEGDQGGDQTMAEKNKVLDKVFLAKYEQDPLVKDVNQIIMNTKCTAVRDAQLLEKSIIEKQLKDENLRLEKIVMESPGVVSQDDEANAAKEKLKKALYKEQITAQMRERENLRFLENQRLIEEAKQIQLANEVYKKLEEEEKKVAALRRKKLMEEYHKVLNMSKLFKKMLCEQDQEAELRIAAYMKEKAEREKKIAEEKKLIKTAAERKQQTIYMLASKLLESKSQQGEMSLLREQERAEREYRKKEREAALRKIQYEKELRENREQQRLVNKQRKAMQIARAEEEFNAMLEAIRQDQKKEEENEKKRQCRRECYRQAIMSQMADKELERRRLEALNKQDAFQFLEAERQREANVIAVVNAKLDQMKQACLPEKYIKEVEDQLIKMKINLNRSKTETKPTTSD